MTVQRTPMARGNGGDGSVPEIITVLVAENPKRKGTMAYDAFALLKTGMTVTEFRELEGKYPTLDRVPGWTRRELAYCVKKKFIRVGASGECKACHRKDGTHTAGCRKAKAAVAHAEAAVPVEA